MQLIDPFWLQRIIISIDGGWMHGLLINLGVKVKMQGFFLLKTFNKYSCTLFYGIFNVDFILFFRPCFLLTIVGLHVAGIQIGWNNLNT